MALVLAASFALVALLSRPERAGARERATASAPTIGLQPLVSGLGSITSITNARDARLFLTIQTGQIRIYSGGAVLPTPFLDVSAFVSCCGERGLLSVAFHPMHAANRFFFVYYTNSSGDIEIARYQTMQADPNRADTTTRTVLLTVPHPTNSNHNGGQLQFGANGYLYIGTGDGGAGNDPPCNAQNDASALGKILRIDVDQNILTPPYYGVPPSNPAAGQAYPRNITWAKGLRNPFRFSFDRATGDLWIGDVGQSAREEVDFQPQASAGGQNYGWKVMEGSICGGGGTGGCSPLPPACGDPSYVLPVYEYDHTLGCAIIGGYVYRGSQDPALYGVYLYGDNCSGNLWGNGQLLTPTLAGLQTFGEDVSGEIYLGTGGGSLYLLTHPVPPPPTPTPAPLGFYTVTPCRVMDTRLANGPYGGPALVDGLERAFVMAGQCGIPPAAVAVSLNVAVTQPSAGPGFLTLYPWGAVRPATATINYVAARTRASNAVVRLGGNGDMGVFCRQGTGTAHVIVDVNGYFQ